MIQGLAIIAVANTAVGRRIARELAQEYSSTALLGADPDALQQQHGALNGIGLDAASLPLDLHSPSELRRVVERERELFDRAAALVCVQADWTAGPVDQLGFADFDPETIPADCAAVLADLVLPVMIRRRFGRIVLITPCLSVQQLPQSGRLPLDGEALGDWIALGRQVGRSRTTINAVSPVYSEAGPALDSLKRQIRYLGLNCAQVMRFLCQCERISGEAYCDLLPALCARLARTDAEFINGMCFLLPLLAKQAAA